MPHHQNYGFSAFPAFPSNTNSMEGLYSEAKPAYGGEHGHGQFLVGDAELEQQLELEPWRGNGSSPTGRITDATIRALAEAALTPLEAGAYNSWEGDFSQPSAQVQSLNEYAEMQANTRGRAEPPPPLQPLSQPLHSPSWDAHHPPDQSQHELYYRYSEPSTSHSLPNQTNIHPFTPIYTSHNPSPTLPHPQRTQHQYAASATGASSPALSEPEAEAKRIRNTAASARFRRKKKAREASLERQSREKREALAKLENRITELEDENKFLKGLVLYRRDGSEERRKEDGQGVSEKERKGRERKDGVGTSI